MIKRMFCKHKWVVLNKQSVWLDGKYGCLKCGKVEKVRYIDDSEWRFKQENRGSQFSEDMSLKEYYMRDTFRNIDALIDEHRLVEEYSADELADGILELITELERKVGEIT